MSVTNSVFFLAIVATPIDRAHCRTLLMRTTSDHLHASNESANMPRICICIVKREQGNLIRGIVIFTCDYTIKIYRPLALSLAAQNCCQQIVKNLFLLWLIEYMYEYYALYIKMFISVLEVMSSP